MLDVHPPEHAAHTWRDFLIHIATIVVGLFIAVGLEQLVELLHRHHQREELREAIQLDAEKAIRDCNRLHESMQAVNNWTDFRIKQVQLALKQHQPLAPRKSEQDLDWDAPIDPAWLAALSSQKVQVLSQEEIQAYSEVSDVVSTLETLHWPMNNSWSRVREIETVYGFDNSIPVSATDSQLTEYLEALVHTRSAHKSYDSWALGVRGSEKAILQGERDLDAVQKAEREPW